MKKFLKNVRDNAIPRITEGISRNRTRQHTAQEVAPQRPNTENAQSSSESTQQPPRGAGVAVKGAAATLAAQNAQDPENMSSLEKIHAKIEFEDDVVKVPGNVNVAVREDSLYIDGKEVQHGKGRDITVIVQGDARNIEYHHDGVLTVEGSTKNVITHYGTVNVHQNVQGFVQTKAGNIQVQGNVEGDVSTGHGMIIN